MDKKLEARIARLERLVNKNEALKKYLRPAKFSWRALEYDIGEKDSFDINDILANYARVGSKPKKILKELLASGDMDEWAKECACSTEELYSSIEQSMYDYDDTSSITLEGRDGDTAKCKVVLPDGKAFTVYMPVYTSESDFDEDDMDENLNRNNNTIELSNELNSRNGDINMNKKLEARIARLERLVNKNESADHQSIVNACSDAWNALVFLQDHTTVEAVDEMLDLIGEVMDELGVSEDVVG